MSECTHLNCISQQALRIQKDLAYEKLQVYLLLTQQKGCRNKSSATVTYTEFLNSGITNGITP